MKVNVRINEMSSKAFRGTNIHDFPSFYNKETKTNKKTRKILLILFEKISLNYFPLFGNLNLLLEVEILLNLINEASFVAENF